MANTRWRTILKMAKPRIRYYAWQIRSLEFAGAVGLTIKGFKHEEELFRNLENIGKVLDRVLPKHIKEQGQDWKLQPELYDLWEFDCIDLESD
ncbi:hypothetical protein B795N_00690 [Marinilactibacillus psychrotolerans]|uniref:hypothetical protein n=1 Tax=Marinilactibacillus psychrotolerans TaxID=191770 RepID=UPI001C7D3AD4|nr:hypothetical protein [Marinilactibacillus psychrotolerans]GEQ32187.1 hypothetical protein B795N_00690 [Marinilactibacillus psychrotolerans]